MKQNRVIPITIVLAVIIVTAVVWSYQQKIETNESNIESPSSQYVTHRDRTTNLDFTYPSSWGDVEQISGNTTCPEEDTYRTADTLSVFDSEYAFDQKNLTRSESLMRSGVRVYTLDPSKKNACGDEFLLMLARGEFKGEALSSIKLERIETADFVGYYNQNASRLNTEYRSQYLLFPKNYSWGKLAVVQPYFSYIPTAGTKDLAEMEDAFSGDMDTYISEGKTSAEIRARLFEFETMVQTISPFRP